MIDKKKLMSDLEGLTFDDWHMFHCDSDVQGIAIDALELLKENDTELERIYQNICAYINDGCSTDTEADKQYVCEMIGRIFKGEPVLLDEEVE